MRLIDLTGKKFGYLTVIRRNGSSMPSGRKGNAKWLCRCICGQERSVVGSKLIRGENRSCGCKKGEFITVSLTTHGMTGTTTYHVWGNMMKRCLNPKEARYYRYGGRGIGVCKRWMKFENFLADMGTRPSRKHSLDRKDNDKGYSKKNCRWATSIQQSNNKSNNRYIETPRGRLTLAQVSRIAGVTPGAIRDRILRGMSGKDLLQPAMAGGRKPFTTS